MAIAAAFCSSCCCCCCCECYGFLQVLPLVRPAATKHRLLLVGYCKIGSCCNRYYAYSSHNSCRCSSCSSCCCCFSHCCEKLPPPPSFEKDWAQLRPALDVAIFAERLSQRFKCQVIAGCTTFAFDFGLRDSKVQGFEVWAFGVHRPWQSLLRSQTAG